MKTLLIFPPASDPSHPPLGIASLAAFLRAHEEEVEVSDLNVVSYCRLLSKASLRACALRLGDRIAALEAEPELRRENAEEYRLMVENSLAADYLQAVVPEALRTLRDPATYTSRQRYARAAGWLRRGMEFVSAAHYPVRWHARGFSMSYLPTRSADVLEAITDPEQNLFVPLFESELDRIVSNPPDLVGISLNYYCQLIPALTLARLTKERLSDATVVIGGGLICFFEDKWTALAPFSHLVDAWIPFEGELPLLDLVRAKSKGEDLSRVSGLLRFDGQQPVFAEPPPPPRPADLPAPSFDGLPLADYVAPTPVLPLLTSRGCYWGRCAFCSHHQVYRGRFRLKTVEQVVEQMDTLARRHGCQHFYFTDECIPPRTARELAAAIQERGLPYGWFTEMRFERGLDSREIEQLAAGGCRLLMFGLESGVQRVLDLMEKGTTPQRMTTLLENCHRAGIRTFVMFFIGFPTETEAEAEETIRLVESLGPLITHIAFSNFILEQRAPVHGDPQRYGIAAILPYENEDLKIYSAYRTEEGLSMEDTMAFLDTAKQRPGIGALVDLHLVSRSHLAFLPPREIVEPHERTRAEALPNDPDRVHPVRSPDLVARKVSFNLEEIRELLDLGDDGSDSPAAHLEKRPTNYVYSSERERLLEVGTDGIELLKACNGRFTLGEILSAVGEDNRATTLQFFDELASKGFLHWERWA